jgi:hypothetical protein
VKKLTYEFVKEQFEKEGYILLTTNYENSRQRLNYICSKGHKHFISWYNWQQGQKCPYCANNIQLTIEFIRAEFKKEDYILLTKIYKNSSQKLNYICSRGHKHSIVWGSWQQGHRCPYCCDNVKPTIEFIRKQFEKEECQLLTTEYRNNRQKLNYVCSNGHKCNVSWNNWQQGKRCRKCFIIGVGKKLRHDIEFIRTEFEKEGYVLLTTEYENCNQKLDYICTKGHKHSIRWSHWNSGHRCYICGIIKNSGSGNSNWKGGISCDPYCDAWADKEYKESIKERDGYKCLNPDCRKNCNYLPLTIHHIDYNKKNCRSDNLITLCNSCNVRANFDRSWYTSWYQTILQKRYGKDYIYAK